MPQPLITFHSNWFSSFWVILLKVRQKDKQSAMKHNVLDAGSLAFVPCTCATMKMVRFSRLLCVTWSGISGYHTSETHWNERHNSPVLNYLVRAACQSYFWFGLPHIPAEMSSKRTISTPNLICISSGWYRTMVHSKNLDYRSKCLSFKMCLHSCPKGCESSFVIFHSSLNPSITFLFSTKHSTSVQQTWSTAKLDKTVQQFTLILFPKRQKEKKR